MARSGTVSNRPTHKTGSFLHLSVQVIALFALSGSALAQVVAPPIVHWIGPDVGTEANPGPCDFATIQEALGEIFDCGLFACPLGRNELRLSNGYQHSGQIVINRSFDIVGGFDQCQGTGSFNLHPLTGNPAEPLMLVTPGGQSIENVLSRVRLDGSAGLASQGGVIRMAAGEARLTLMNTTIADGNADDGGGVYLSGDGNRLNIVDSQINANQALRGGGIFCTNGGVVDFRSGIIQQNTAQLSGGGIYLEGGCQLLGNDAGVDRRVLLNEVGDTQLGEGGGIYALNSVITFGAPLSRTQIDDNSVQWLPLHNYEQPGQNNGGGVHLESTEATFHNTWFRGNAAADGGAISVSGRTVLLVDRFSGPCTQDQDEAPQRCSVFEFNRARGGTDSGGDEGGDGSVLFARSQGGFSPVTNIYRSTMRSNVAGCYEADEEDFEGECDLGVGSSSSQSMISRADRLAGNLIYGNSIGDDEDSVASLVFKEGIYFGFVRLFSENTVTQNVDSDHLFKFSPDRLINNIIWDVAVDDAVGGNLPAPIVLSSCNVSNFADELDGLAELINIPTENQYPEFTNDVIGSNEDFRLNSPQSPALDRCDEEDGFLNLTYDIVGVPRGLDLASSANGSGERDAGAFEATPIGFVNQTADLQVTIESDTPGRAEQGQAHTFEVDVGNVGQNDVESFEVNLSLAEGGVIESLVGGQGFDPNTGNLVPIWDCNAAAGRCQYLPNTLLVGATSSTITAEISHQSTGTQSVVARLELQDPTLTDLNPSNDEAAAEVTVGPGADLQLAMGTSSLQLAVGQLSRVGFSVRNHGLLTAEQIQLRLDLAATSAQLVSVSAPGWDCSLATGICDFLTPLQAVDPAQDFWIDLQFGSSGQQVLMATVAAIQGDPDLDSNSRALAFNVAPAQDALFSSSFESSAP